MASLTHLAGRFAGSLSTRPPNDTDIGWAELQLLPGERLLWHRLPVADQRHSIAVAREVKRLLGAEATRPVLAAALLHDVGKLASGYGTMRRVWATVAAGIVGRDRLSRGSGRLALYLRHDEAGADFLAEGDSDPLTIAWTAEHHQPPSTWTLDLRVASALKAADDD